MSSNNHDTPLRWGILGAGSIAKSFAADVRLLSDHQLVAIGSRDQAKADAFGTEFQIPNRHASYEALCNDSEVDAIYVATPHNFHKEHCLLALNSNKPVLCEKPFTVNKAEADAVIAVAKAKNLFLMEGMWSRFFPVWDKVRELIASGAIGKVRMVYADFGFRTGPSPSNIDANNQLIVTNPTGRHFDINLIGGALMDVGVYPVSLAQMLLGDPDSVAALGTIGVTGIDDNTGMLLHFPGGEMAVTSTSFQVSTPQTAILIGESGKIEVPNWWTPKRLTLSVSGKDPETFELPHEGRGFQFEAIEVARCLRAGLTESPILSHSDSLAVMGALDQMRAQIGLKYPDE
jgi:predicted dehydrogenase